MVKSSSRVRCFTTGGRTGSSGWISRQMHCSAGNKLYGECSAFLNVALKNVNYTVSAGRNAICMCWLYTDKQLLCGFLLTVCLQDSG